MTAIWDQHNLEARITEILTQVQPNPQDHHFGRPYMSAYQLAIAFAHHAPDAFTAIGHPIGGEGIGQHTSLAQYIARELSGRIKNDRNYPIEGAFLSNRYLHDLTYTDNGNLIRSSLISAGLDLSLFRLRTDR